MKSLRFLLLSLCVLSGMRGQDPSLAAGGSQDGQIASVRDAWVKAWDAKQIDSIIPMYAADAVYLTETGERITGQEAIGTYLKTLIGTSVVSHAD